VSTEDIVERFSNLLPGFFIVFGVVLVIKAYLRHDFWLLSIVVTDWLPSYKQFLLVRVPSSLLNFTSKTLRYIITVAIFHDFRLEISDIKYFNFLVLWASQKIYTVDWVPLYLVNFTLVCLHHLSYSLDWVPSWIPYLDWLILATSGNKGLKRMPITWSDFLPMTLESCLLFGCSKVPYSGQTIFRRRYELDRAERKR
jgi:hypothetical protein